tara:strand:- start:78 stop:218 length:141 start_codon:yes stop_codon:yes gene_type:complete
MLAFVVGLPDDLREVNPVLIVSKYRHSVLDVTLKVLTFAHVGIRIP